MVSRIVHRGVVRCRRTDLLLPLRPTTQISSAEYCGEKKTVYVQADGQRNGDKGLYPNFKDDGMLTWMYAT